MLELESPTWATFSHAYGDASDIPKLLIKLRTASENEWSDVNDELMSAILHQGDTYTATYAAAPHLVKLASDYGPCWQSDDLLQAIGYASRGGPGPVVPESLDEDWQDAQSDARDLILERLIDQQASESYTGSLIGALLYLSGEWTAGKLVTDWCWGTSLAATCRNCQSTTSVFWHDNGPNTSTVTPRRFWRQPQFKIVPISVSPTGQDGFIPDPDLEFDDDHLFEQILGLAAASGHSSIKRQFQILFGTVKCTSCGHVVEIASAVDTNAS